MRKLFLLSYFCSISILLSAQHLNLDYRVPIDGSVSSVEFNLLNNEFTKESDFDKKGRKAFSGMINGKRSLVYVLYDTNRPILDNLVYSMKVFSFFDSKEEASQFMESYYSVLYTVMNDQSPLDKSENNIDSDKKFKVSNENGCVTSVMYETKKGDFGVETLFEDYKNSARVTKTWDYYGTPAIGSNGIYDISPENIKVHGR